MGREQQEGQVKEEEGGGGGGLCRAFVSHMSKLSSMRKETGQVDFSRIISAWKVERAKEHSEVLEELHPGGTAATQARKQQRETGTLAANVQERMSSFGNVHRKARARTERERVLAELHSAVQRWCQCSSKTHFSTLSLSMHTRL